MDPFSGGGAKMGVFSWVFLIGCVFGSAELISRHSDYRLRALLTAPSIAYLFLNGFLSVFALLAINYIRPEWLGFKPGADGSAAKTPDEIWLVLASGFGAAAFFRSSIFKLKTSDGELSVGPAIVIDIFLKVIDEAVDRVMAKHRLIAVSRIMQGTDFAKSSKLLPTVCFAGLRRLSPDLQSQFAVQLKELTDTPNMIDKVKSLSLGLSIMNLTGRPILEEAVNQLKDDIK